MSHAPTERESRNAITKKSPARKSESVAAIFLVCCRRLCSRPFGLILASNSDICMESGGRGITSRSIPRDTVTRKGSSVSRAPLQWATTQNNLGNALARIGERGSGADKLEEAVAAYREALKEFTRERTPLDWAMTQNNLGFALWRLGERESGIGKFEEAVAACREALKEWTRARVPLQWATKQNNLGLALAGLGERESGTGKLEEAVSAYREALKEWTEEAAPSQHRIAQENLDRANALLPQRRNK